MTDRELMQWALDALDGYARNCRCEGGGGTTDAAEALRNRLEKWTARDMAYRPGGLSQPEQEPMVKWDASASLVVHPHPAFQATQPDLAKVGEVGIWGERQWQGLTDEQVKQIEMSASSTLSAIYLAEAQLKGKNT